MRESIEVQPLLSAVTNPSDFNRALWLTGLGVVGGLSWGNGPVLAQTTVELPTAQPRLAAPQPAATASPLPAAVAPPESFGPEFAREPVRPAPSINSQLAPALANPRAVPVTKADIPLPQVDYEAPSAVVFSERSSGCEVTLNQGQELTQTLCGQKPSFASPLAAPNAALPIAPAAPAEPADYTPPRSGPFGFSTAGISVNLPTIKPYFNRSARPLGRPGNGNISLLFPLALPAPITSLFGWRTHPITGDSRFHSGTDLGAPMGTPVLAALAGQVALADFFGGYGLAVALNHSKGTQQTLYGHMSEIFVKPGEWVKQGTVVGRVGSTGASTGPHLHFEFRQLTADGWVAQDAGLALEQALAQLVQSIQVAQAPMPPTHKSGQLLPPIARSPVAQRLAPSSQSPQVLALARQLAIATQANQPLQRTVYNAQKLPIGRLASIPVVE